MKKILLILMILPFIAVSQTKTFNNIKAKGYVIIEDSLQLNGSVYVDGIVSMSEVGQTVNTTTVNAATYSLLSTDFFLSVTYTSTGACTITLPTAQNLDGRTIVIKDKGGASTFSIAIVTQGIETIDGQAVFFLNTAYDAINLTSDGTEWMVH